MCWWSVQGHAQTKKKSSPPQDAPKRADTVYIEKKAEPARPQHQYNPATDMKETVIEIYLNDTAPKPKPTYRDTVIILKKGLTKEELAAKQKVKIVEIQKNNNYCQCVKMDIKVAPVLQYETYLNYDFVFRKNCKIDIGISSNHFRFTPYNAFDKPVKVLRKLSFVKRFGHPDFVKLEPGETYTFNYSDDAFFEYDLQKGQSYKFLFEHRNFGDRTKYAPEKTYLCGQKRTQVILVK